MSDGNGSSPEDDNGAFWDPETIRADLAEVDWSAELNKLVEYEGEVDAAHMRLAHWMSTPVPGDPDTRRGDILMGLYMRTFARTLGYQDRHTWEEDHPEMHDLYRSVVQGLLMAGLLIQLDSDQIPIHGDVLAYWEDEDGEPREGFEDW